MADIDYEALSVNNASNLAEAAIKSTEVKKAKIKSAIKSAVGKNDTIKQPKAHSSKSIKDHALQVSKLTQQIKDDEDKPLLESAFRKYNSLVNKFPEHVPREPKIKSNSELADVQLAIKLTLSNIMANSADRAAYAGFAKIADAIEWVTMDKGFNPFQLNLRGFGRVVKEELSKGSSLTTKDPNVYEPELSIGAIELQDYLTWPWWAMLAEKLSETAKILHQHHTGISLNNGATPVDNDIRKNNNDL